MRETRRHPNLAQEPFGSCVRHVPFENFNGDRAIVTDVPREIDRRHAAASELALDRVAS